MNAPKRIVIADSEVEFARTLSAVLEQRGYSVALCHDGLECVSRIREDPPALLIVDTQLPVLDGLQVVGVVREIRPDLPVIVMSAYDIPGLKRDAADAGAYACLIKPFEADHLAGLVEQALSGRSRGATAAKRPPLLSLARLEAGHPVLLELRSGEYTGRYPSRLLERHAASLVVASPAIGGVAFAPAFGSRVTVGYALGDGWYHFETRVIGTTSEQGEAALLLAQPKLVTHLQRRRHSRFPVALPARCVATGAEAGESQAQLVDLSLGGARMKGSVSLPPGTRVVVTARAPEPAGEMTLQALAVWSRRGEPQQGGYETGLRFMDLGEAAEAGPARWLEQMERLSAASGGASVSWLPIMVT